MAFQIQSARNPSILAAWEGTHSYLPRLLQYQEIGLSPISISRAIITAEQRKHLKPDP
jgi:hypothetical protein